MRLSLGVLSWIGAFVLAMTLSGMVQAQSLAPGDIDRGRDAAKMWCSHCHIVVPEQSSPVIVGVPPFSALAADPAKTAEGFRQVISNPHPVIPTHVLTRQQIEDLTAFYATLRDPE